MTGIRRGARAAADVSAFPDHSIGMANKRVGDLVTKYGGSKESGTHASVLDALEARVEGLYGF